MTVYSCCPFFNENDIFEIRVNTQWDFVDKFIIVEAGETHTGHKKPFNFDRERFKKYESKIIYVTFDNFAEEMAKFPKLDCELGKQAHRHAGNVLEDWARDHFQANYLYKVLMDQGAKDDDIVYLSPVDEIISKDAFERALERFTDKSQKFNARNGFNNAIMMSGVRPFFGFHFYFYVYKFNLLASPNMVAGLITEVETFHKILPATLRSYSLTTHDHIKDGGWHFSYADDTDGEKVMLKHKSWAHARDTQVCNGQVRYEITDKQQSINLINTEFNLVKVPILSGTHPQYIIDNQDKFSKYIL